MRGGSGAPDGDRADDERQPVRTVDELVAAAMAGDSDTVNRLLAAAPGLRERAIERRPSQLVRAAGQNSCDAVALLIELGFDVNARPRTAPLHEAAMHGNIAIIRLLLEHGADPSLRDTAYHATPAGWAEHAQWLSGVGF